MNHLARPAYDYFKPTLVSFVDEIVSKVRAVGKKVKGTVSNFVEDVMMNFVQRSGMLDRIKDIAMDVAGKECMDEIKKDTKTVKEVLPSLGSSQHLWYNWTAKFQDA